MSYCVIQTRQEICETVNNMFEYVQTNCLGCNFCFHCKLLINLRKEIVRMGFDLVNSDIAYWSIDWLLKKCEIKPLLKYYILDGDK